MDSLGEENLSFTPISFGFLAVRRGRLPIGLLCPMAGGWWYGATDNGPTDPSKDRRAVIEMMESLIEKEQGARP